MSILDKIAALFGGGNTTTSASSPAASGSSAPAGAGKIDRVLVGESLVGEGNEVAHIDLLMGPRGGSVEKAFANALSNNKDGFTSFWR